MSRGASRVLVVESDGRLEDLLATLGDGAEAALDQGRLFIEQRRAKSRDEEVRVGERVVIHPPRPEVSGARVLSQRDDVIAAFKPAGMPTIPDHRGAKGSLLDTIESEVGARLHTTSRLDVGVSGVVLLTASEGAATRLVRAREQGLYRRRYVAIATKAPSSERGTWSFPIGRDPNPRKRRIGGSSATRAETKYSAVALTSSGNALLALEPQTGRTHQLRLHASHAGCPLLGDSMYGGPARLVSATGAVTKLSRIALHCAWVEVPDARGDTWRIEAEVPEEMLAMWRAVGGGDEVWQRALAP